MFSRILVPVDGSELSERSIPHAIHIAQLFQSELILLNILESNHPDNKTNLIDPLNWQIRKAETDLYLQTLAKKVRDQHPKVEHLVLEGRAPQAIVQYAHENAVDLVVMSTHGKGGLSKWNLSSVTQKVISKVFLPVLVVRAYLPASDEVVQYKKILVPFDCSKRAECSLPSTVAIAQANQAQVLLLTVLRRPDVPFSTSQSNEINRLVDEFMALSRQATEAYHEELRGRFQIETENRIIESASISQAIQNMAEEEKVDLVIMCAHGHSGQADWPYGTIAWNYIENGTTPALILQDVPHTLVNPTKAEIAAEKYGSRG